MNKISTYIQHMASCRDINDCTIVPCASQHCTDVARNISTNLLNQTSRHFLLISNCTDVPWRVSTLNKKLRNVKL